MSCERLRWSLSAQWCQPLYPIRYGLVEIFASEVRINFCPRFVRELLPNGPISRSNGQQQQSIFWA
jgi:hypothetical protein